MKNIKIISVVLSMLLLIGAVIGITAFAADTPSVEIARKNISYDGAVKTLYALDAQNVGEGKVGVQFYSVDPATEGATADYTKYASEKITIGETEYDVVFSKGFYPAELRKSIWAVPVIVNGDTVVAKGAAVEYSPYIYAMNRFDQEATGDQFALYTALLEYGAAVQRVLSTPAEVEAAGGYADEYYKVTLKSALATDLANATEATTKTYSKAAIEAGEITAADTYSDTAFVAFANADGDPVRVGGKALTAVDVKPGTNSFTALYGKYDIVRVEQSDFASGNPAGFIETAYNIKNVCANTTATFAYKDKEDWKGTSSLAIVDGAMVHTKELINKDTFTGTDEEYSNANYQWWRMWFTSSAGDQDVYIAEFDAKFNNIAGNGHYFMEANDHTIRVTITPSAEKDENGYAEYFTLGTATLNPDTNYKIRYEWYADSDTVAVYVDGALVYTQTAAAPITKDVNYSSFSFAYGAGLTGVTTFDNMYCATACVHDGYVINTTVKAAIVKDAAKTFYKSCAECKLLTAETGTSDGTKDTGKYYNSDLNGTRYDMNTVPQFTKSSSAAFTYGVSDGILNIQNNAYGVNTIRVLNASGAKSSTTVVPGTKFVCEFDIMYSGCDTTSANTDTYQFMGLAKAADGGSGSCSWLNNYFNYEDKYCANFETGTKDAVFAQGVWYNYRIEYTMNEDGTATYVKYVNDVSVETDKISSAPTVLYGWAFESRNASIPVSYSMDNMFFGIICVGEHTFTENTENGNAYIGAGEFYKSCSKCGFLGTETFVGAESVALGTGTYYANANMSGYRQDYTGVWIGTDTAKGVFVSNNGAAGSNYTLTKEGTNDVLSLNSNNWTLASLRAKNFPSPSVVEGDKLVAEFDFKVNDGYNTSTDTCFIKFSISAKASGSDSGQFSPQVELKANADGISYALGTAKLYAGIWYNVRFEQIVNGAFNVYVNNELAYSGTANASPASTIYYGLSVVCRGTIVDTVFDNYFVAVNPTEATSE